MHLHLFNIWPDWVSHFLQKWFEHISIRLESILDAFTLKMHEVTKCEHGVSAQALTERNWMLKYSCYYCVCLFAEHLILSDTNSSAFNNLFLRLSSSVSVKLPVLQSSPTHQILQQAGCSEYFSYEHTNHWSSSRPSELENNSERMPNRTRGHAVLEFEGCKPHGGFSWGNMKVQKKARGINVKVNTFIKD